MLSKQLICNLVLAGGLLAMPAFAQDTLAPIAGGPNSIEAISEVPETSVATSEDANEGLELASAPGMAAHEECCKLLNLSDDQMEKLINLKSQLAINTAVKKAELKANFEQIMLLMSKPTVDRDKILSLNDKNNALKTELSKAHINFMLSASDVFTAEQNFMGL